MTLSPSGLREEIAEALRIATALDAEAKARLLDFEQGNADYPLDSFELDSLAMMEFCIALELSTGAQVSPAQIADGTTLVGIFDLVRRI
jgi:acyl carrier protein